MSHDLTEYRKLAAPVLGATDPDQPRGGLTMSVLRTYAARTVAALGGIAVAGASFVAGVTDLATTETAVTGALSGLVTAATGLITEGLVYSRKSYDAATREIPRPVLDAIEQAALVAASTAVERAQREITPGRP